jgi:diguanylate cyclase (GGDEF)-like protein/PAS domain S-box-containing protein
MVLEDSSALQDALDALRRSEKRYSDLIENIPAGIVLHAGNSEIRTANAQASRLLGLTLEQMKGRAAIDPEWQFLREDGSPMPASEFPVNQVISTGNELQHLVVGIRHPGKDDLVWVICNAYPVAVATGALQDVIVSFTEITDLKKTERELQRSEERLRLILRGSNDAPWDWDMVAGTLYYSPRWWQMLGHEDNAFNMDTSLWASMLHPQDKDRVLGRLQQFLDSGTESYEIEFRLQHHQGHYVSVLSRGFILRNAAGEPIRISGTNADLTERKQAEEQIHRLAFYDALTDLPNRRFLMEQLKIAMAAGGRTGDYGALLFIDLDHFKELNDSLGHDSGDELLRQVAQRLRRAVRESDMVARLGGDEFVVMLENLSAEPGQAGVEAERIGKKLLDALNQTYSIFGRSYLGTPSIGVALFNAASEGVETLLKQADLAMYQAKAHGRNTMNFFDESMQAAVDQRVALEADLRNGLRRGEMVLHYQPQVHRARGVTGAEVLVRWQHPDKGLVPPGLFIPLAELTGLVLPLGRWVMRTACEQLAQWSVFPELARLTLAVNVSVHQFKDPGFTAHVLETIVQTGADPSRLKLELTESALVDDMEEVIGKMDQLRGHGITFSLDDFGTGFSSLAYLKRLPLDQLKIDRAFVRDVLTDPGDAAISRMIVTLAKEFGLSVIAEGVETEAQNQFLADSGCDDYQGYLYGKPMPIGEFEAWLGAR